MLWSMNPVDTDILYTKGVAPAAYRKLPADLKQSEPCRHAQNAKPLAIGTEYIPNEGRIPGESIALDPESAVGID